MSGADAQAVEYRHTNANPKRQPLYVENLNGTSTAQAVRFRSNGVALTLPRRRPGMRGEHRDPMLAAAWHRPERSDGEVRASRPQLPFFFGCSETVYRPSSLVSRRN
jgi:hypothetical protein